MKVRNEIHMLVCSVEVNITLKIDNIKVLNFSKVLFLSFLLFVKFLYVLYIVNVIDIRFAIVIVCLKYLVGIVDADLRFSNITCIRNSHHDTNIVPTLFGSDFFQTLYHVQNIRNTHSNVVRVLVIDLPLFRR